MANPREIRRFLHRGGFSAAERAPLPRRSSRKRCFSPTMVGKLPSTRVFVGSVASLKSKFKSARELLIATELAKAFAYPKRVALADVFASIERKYREHNRTAKKPDLVTSKVISDVCLKMTRKGFIKIIKESK